MRYAGMRARARACRAPAAVYAKPRGEKARQECVRERVQQAGSMPRRESLSVVKKAEAWEVGSKACQSRRVYSGGAPESHWVPEMRMIELSPSRPAWR